MAAANLTLRSFAQYGTRPHRSTSRLRSLALASYRTTGSGSVGATFQLGGKLGVGRCGGIEKTSLISLTSEQRRTRPHYLNLAELGRERQAWRRRLFGRAPKARYRVPFSAAAISSRCVGRPCPKLKIVPPCWLSPMALAQIACCPAISRADSFYWNVDVRCPLLRSNKVAEVPTIRRSPSMGYSRHKGRGVSNEEAGRCRRTADTVLRAFGRLSTGRLRRPAERSPGRSAPSLAVRRALGDQRSRPRSFRSSLRRARRGG